MRLQYANAPQLHARIMGRVYLFLCLLLCGVGVFRSLQAQVVLRTRS